MYTVDGYQVEQDGEIFIMGNTAIMPVVASAPVLDARFVNSRHEFTRYGWVKVSDLVSDDCTDYDEYQTVDGVMAYCPDGLDDIPY